MEATLHLFTDLLSDKRDGMDEKVLSVAFGAAGGHRARRSRRIRSDVVGGIGSLVLLQTW
jgi:hypothetical protein